MFIVDLINKDVKAENESKRTMVALRILYIVEFIAFIFDLIFVGSEIFKVYPYRVYGFLITNIGLFIYTYFSKTIVSLVLFMVYLFVWTLSMIPCFGWSAGMQNYYIIILMLCFFALYGRAFYKFIYTGMVLAFRIMTIGLYGGTKSILDIGTMSDKLLQITNISAVFISIIFISYVFSQRENEQEEKLIKYNDMLKKEASTDKLTGLYNRRKLEESLDELQRESKFLSVSLAIGDIDFFKKVNDTYGHDAGDKVLKHVAGLMTESCPNGSIISRWGGEEFLIVFKDYNGDEAYVFLEKLRHIIQNKPTLLDGKVINVTMTFGLIEYAFKETLEDAVKEADSKLYYGKEHGRNQVVY